jgi:hypothetical protein
MLGVVCIFIGDLTATGIHFGQLKWDVARDNGMIFLCPAFVLLCTNTILRVFWPSMGSLSLTACTLLQTLAILQLVMHRCNRVYAYCLALVLATVAMGGIPLLGIRATVGITALVNSTAMCAWAHLTVARTLAEKLVHGFFLPCILVSMATAKPHLFWAAHVLLLIVCVFLMIQSWINELQVLENPVHVELRELVGVSEIFPMPPKHCLAPEAA